MSVTNARNSGELLHPTSLPGPFGIGDLGPEAYRFVDFLSTCGQSYWPMLPLGPIGYGNSPYMCFSAFAGNPLLLSPERLAEDGLLDIAAFGPPPPSPPDRVNYGATISYKNVLLRKSFQLFKTRFPRSYPSDYYSFLQENAFWLEGYAFFMALKEENHGRIWGEWEKGPGADLFKALNSSFDNFPVIAEDLGVITPEVEELREEFDFPGMRILQMAFGNDPKAVEYRPHNFPRNCVVYSSTHDHNTTLGWFTAEPGTQSTQSLEEIKKERAYALEYLGVADGGGN